MRTYILLSILGLLSACGQNATFEAVDYQCRIEGEYIICPDGSRVQLPQDGIDGRDGRDGIDGAPGQNGDDGRDGIDGNDGRDGTIVNVIDPCGDYVHPNGPDSVQSIDEVILHFDDGTFLAWFKNLGLTVLHENVSYQTTDKQKCNFTIINGQVVSQ